MLSFLFSLLFAGIAGYVAGRIMKSNFSTLKCVLIGLVGGFVGSIIFGLVGLGSTGFVGNMVISIIGACVCIWLARKFLR